MNKQTYFQNIFNIDMNETSDQKCWQALLETKDKFFSRKISIFTF